MVFYAQSTSAVISEREREREREKVNWCFTPSQPVRLYHRERVIKLVFYAQSTSAVISEREGKSVVYWD